MLDNKPRILVVDDEPNLVELLAYNLRAAGYEVETASDGRRGLEKARQLPPDLLILDLMMPELPGLDVARRLRENEATRSVPIIMLTAKGEDADQLRGFRVGADDYMAKPFSVELLLARVDAVLRRAKPKSGQDGAIKVYGPLRIDTGTFQVFLDDELMSLTVTEFRLLSSLLAAEGKVLSRRALIASAMGPGVTVTERTIDVHVTAIRRKLGPHADLILTVRGVGYRTVLPGHEAASSAQ